MPASITDVERDLVRIALASFEANDDDTKVFDAIMAAGVPEASANELVAFVPLALGRRVVRRLGVTPLDAFDAYDGDPKHAVEFAFADERFYVAAEELASYVGDPGVRRATAWSSEVDALNAMLRTRDSIEGVRFTKALVYLPQRVGRGAGAARPADPRDLTNACAELAALLVAHGVKGDLVGDAFVTDLGDRWFTRVLPHRLTKDSALVQLDVCVDSPRVFGSRTVIESYVGTSTSLRGAIRDAIEAFATGALHVLLGVLSNSDAYADQVSWERWEGPTGAWDVCFGPLIMRGADDAPAVDFEPMIERMQAIVESSSLERIAHTFRVFRWFGPGPSQCEGLLDGADWPVLLAAVETWVPTGASEVLVSVRNFGVLVPVPIGEGREA